jgi:hypothetical protein
MTHFKGWYIIPTVEENVLLNELMVGADADYSL